jgi:hypothetical protein
MDSDVVDIIKVALPSGFSLIGILVTAYLGRRIVAVDQNVAVVKETVVKVADKVEVLLVRRRTSTNERLLSTVLG